MKSEVYKEHTMEPDFTRPHFRFWSLNTSFASAIVRPFDTILRLLIEKGILSPPLLNESQISRSPLNEIISDEGLVPYLVIHRWTREILSSPLESFPSKFTIVVELLPDVGELDALVLDQLKEYLFPIGVKYGKNICLSDGYAYAGA